MLADVGLEIDRVTAALDGVYSAVVINDILEREKRKGQRNITDPVLLKKSSCFWRTILAITLLLPLLEIL